jgi:hypothetical protein
MITSFAGISLRLASRVGWYTTFAATTAAALFLSPDKANVKSFFFAH